ncbi:hypothetical protein [Methylobacterium planeticum]|uniref:Uncharacterized protein n=1 Tax=Methylobacterium planeticum TaxID=2615211 RepID=A0A6N6MUV7_9HYPH|nr:hypothetical protein [Methylobacterium planeticum]KAB1074919.1 hypothetical protein F6X51_07325 [Methylobacterium planeticum]
MRFFINFDHGGAIGGSVIPDNAQAPGRVAVSVDGIRIAEVTAQIVDAGYVSAGWHSTGQCTFWVTEDHIPTLAEIPRLELYDVDTNLLIYRRVPKDALVEKRVLLINTGIHPESAVQGHLFGHFRQSYFGIQKLSEEMMHSVCGQNHEMLNSCLFSGALTVPRFEHFFQGENDLTVALVHDPHVEMATRLLWLRDRAAMAADPAWSWRLGPLAEAATFVSACDLGDLKGLKRLFRMMPLPAYNLLYNPLTRQFGTRMPDDRVHPGNSIVAIEILARVGIVGHRAFFGAFMDTLQDRLGLDLPVPVPAPVPEEARDLAQRLRQVKAVEDMLVFDVAMSDAVRSAVSKGWSA